MMFRRLQKQLQDTELGTGSGTTGTRTCTYVRVQWGYSWIAENLNDWHPLFQSRCWRQGNQENLKDLILEPTQMFCPHNDMQATGIPALYVFMHSQSLLNKEVITAIENGPSHVPAPAPPRSSTSKDEYVRSIE
jgi:hypothetical protein